MPTRGRMSKSACVVRSRPSSSSVRCETQIVVRRPVLPASASPAPTTSSTSRCTSARCEPLASGRCRATPASPRRGAPEPSTAAAALRSRAVRPWRSMLVTSSTTNRAPGRRSWRSPHVLEPGDRVHDPAVQVVGHLERRPERPPRGQHQQVSGEPGGHLGQLGVGADGEGVAAQPVRLAGQPAEPEPVAVALRDRHQSGLGGGDRTQVGAPAVAVDREGEAHPDRRFMATWNAR